jgi:hypothetical protein
MLLWKMVAQDCAAGCHTSITMDYKTVQGRCKHEGLSFLTITLPAFGKDFEKSLDQAKVDRNLFQSFGWKGGLPKFLWGFLDLVFDRTSGVLLDEPCIDSIRSIRQLTLMFGKMKLQCTPEREMTAMRSFLECEQDVRASDARLSESLVDSFKRVSSLLFGSAFSQMDLIIYQGLHIPKHGPGSTAEKLSSNAKYLQKTWPARLDGYFPLVDFILPNARYYEHLGDVDILDPGSEIPVRVISVPKTQKTPRIIAIEPTAMQYAQQAVLDVIRYGLDKVDYLRTMIGLDDQEPNRALAHRGSLYGNLATLDLSEASDRVSNQHVRFLLARHPHLHAAVDASRSRKADIPGYGVKRLAKFASMGSALCFPMEAMVFLTIIFMGIEQCLNTSLTKRDVKRLSGSVRVFGDDIIVPSDCVDHVIRSLEAFGLVVNSDKSFWTGRFRESCGKEYYAGHDVSICRVRQMFPTRREHAQEIISTVSLRNQLYWAGYWGTCKWLDGKIRDVIKHFPTVLPTSPVLGRQSALGFETQRIGEHLHDPLVRGYVVSSRPPSDKLDGYGALLKCLLRLEWNSPPKERYRAGGNTLLDIAPGGFYRSGLDHLAGMSGDERHLERAGRPSVVDIKLRWSSAV